MHGCSSWIANIAQTRLGLHVLAHVRYVRALTFRHGLCRRLSSAGGILSAAAAASALSAADTAADKAIQQSALTI